MRSFTLILFFTFLLPLHAQQTDFVDIDFRRADSIANQLKGEELYNIPVLVHQLTSQLDTDIEKFRAIYYWVCHNIRGEYYMMYKNTHKRKALQHDKAALAVWNNTFKKEVFTKLLRDKETLCTGYAYLVKEMASLADFECEIILGFGIANDLKFGDLETPNHSWNSIKLNGKWYLCDATWSSGIIDMKTFIFNFKYDDSYFLMKPIEFLKSHRPVNMDLIVSSEFEQ